MSINGRKSLIILVFGSALAACTTSNDKSDITAAKPNGPVAIDRGVAAFRDICFAHKAPYTESYAAAARYGVKKFQTKEGSSWLSGKYMYSEGATDDQSLIVGINPKGLCTVRDRRRPDMADDSTIEKQFAAVIHSRYPLADKLHANSVSYTTVENWKTINFGFAFDYHGYNMFSSPL
ncbi:MULTISPECIES: hypothetical protein [unclassified Rhizobium]|uniref:hypothetical protein n=1 Tax=unclassified Rhizobium TaxID=2613769 RepID=UPI001ADC2BEF|nr:MULTISPECIES: hypothetical protein [unclassified Rhizobium]MBO9102336.1 hypothetical protein [Rhizobium sp. L58/93]MBO9172361.1 hypothetical protein [Rhizobium sp. L245/93]MBO9188204.1 hypothetical protein [Rhizobium sp. E27B/91]QXZ86262.1 hypothetical protein J5287_24665 [Rhizobium sp. K1/93]QXZ92283.1 hypothetical protein J5280_24520 [Rhizobium sp. K15/93]